GAWGGGGGGARAGRLGHSGSALGQGPWGGLSGPADRAIQDALFAGWAEVGPLTTSLSADDIAQWLAQRRDYLAAGRSSLRVGHVDIFARPIGSRWALRSQSSRTSLPRLWARMG